MIPVTTRILLVDDHPLVRSGLCGAINDSPDLQVCGEAGSLKEALDLARQTRPGLVVLDMNLGDGNGWKFLECLRQEGQLPPTLMLSVNDELVYAERVLRAGAQGYLMKDEPVAKILQAIRKVAAGHVAISDVVATAMLQQKASDSPAGEQRDLEALSDREFQVFELLVEGLNNEEMAARLGISPKTISTYKARLMTKLGARTTPHLISIISKRMRERGGAAE